MHSESWKKTFSSLRGSKKIVTSSTVYKLFARKSCSKWNKLKINVIISPEIRRIIKTMGKRKRVSGWGRERAVEGEERLKIGNGRKEEEGRQEKNRGDSRKSIKVKV